VAKHIEIQMRQARIRELFLQYAGQELTSKQITELLNLPLSAERTIRNDLRELIKQGFPIETPRRGKYLFRGRKTSYLRKDLRFGSDDIRRLWLLAIVAEKREVKVPELYKELEKKFKEFEQEIGFSYETLQNDFRELTAGGFLLKKDEVFQLGKKFLPIYRHRIKKELNEVIRELERKYRYMQYNPLLSEVLNKLKAYRNTFIYTIDTHIEEYFEERRKIRYYHGPREHVEETLIMIKNEISRALFEEKKIKVTYKGKEQFFYPLGLVYNQNNQAWYLIAKPVRKREAAKKLRLDRIEQLEVLEEPIPKEVETCVKAMVAPGWGIGTGRKEKVKVLFYNRANAIDRVKPILEVRKVVHPTCNYYFDSAGNLIFEDYISGIEEFLSWLRQFGANALILEPASLMEKYRETLKKLAELYPEVQADE